MTIPKTERLLFIEQASFKRSAFAPVLLTFSLPARSTKNILDVFYMFFFSAYFY